MAGGAWTRKDNAELRDLRGRRNLPWKEIARALGRSVAACQLHACRTGVRGLHNGLAPEVVRALLADCGRGLSDGAAAHRHGVSKRTVFKYRKLAGVAAGGVFNKKGEVRDEGRRRTE